MTLFTVCFVTEFEGLAVNILYNLFDRDCMSLMPIEYRLSLRSDVWYMFTSNTVALSVRAVLFPPVVF